MECVGAVDWWFGWVGAGEALAETPEFLGVRGAPEVFVLGVFDELAVFEGLACFVVED